LRVQLLTIPLLGNNLGQVVHTCLCYQAVQFGTSRGTAMSCGWEGNRRSGVALAMHHRLEWFIHLRAQVLSKGDEHPANTPHWVWNSLPFLLISEGSFLGEIEEEKWRISECRFSWKMAVTHTYNHFTALFQDHPGEPVPEEKFGDFVVQGKINRGRYADHPAGCHSIWTEQCPPPPSPILYRQDALPAAQPTVSKH